MIGRLARRFGETVERHALSPLDGRYADKVQPLIPYFSEAAFMKFRVTAEVEWLKHLARRGVIPLSKRTSTEEFSSILPS
jgi:adenylosuccinate lyase